MLELYKDKQPLIYEALNNSVTNNKLSHAYLIETNNYSDSDGLIMTLVKDIFKLYVSDSEYENISTLIDNDSLDDFILIETDGINIKKEEVLNIKDKFATTSFNNRPRIYLIKDADKLNKYAANSLLKFLEEPEGNIIAILTTTNRYKVLETIRSRCQLYSLVSDTKETIEDENNTYELIKILEEYKEKAIAYLPINLDLDFKNKKLVMDIFKKMISIYEMALRKKEDIENIDNEVINIIVEKNKSLEIINKINVLFEILNDMEYNLNMNMAFDRFILDFSGGK